MAVLENCYKTTVAADISLYPNCKEKHQDELILLKSLRCGVLYQNAFVKPSSSSIIITLSFEVFSHERIFILDRLLGTYI